MSTNLRRLSKYELQELLGHGGMAEVWKAYDTQLRRYVAIKLLLANLQADPNFITRFLREAQLIASLHHPNIVQIHDFQVSQPPESASPTAYMVMDYVAGQTLADYIRKTSRMGKFPSGNEMVRLFTSISLAVDYAHQRGMIHRDIKPANILLDSRNTTMNTMGEPVLSDFGIAKLLGISSGTVSGSGAWLSTPYYISPEQAQGQPGNERSDIYALGVILYEILTGVPPFQGDHPAAIMMQHINALPTSPALFNPNTPPVVIAVTLRALAKDPTARYSSASALTIALADAFNVPAPESLGKTAQQVDAMNTPTIRVSRANLTPSGSSSSPSWPMPSGSTALASTTPVIPQNGGQSSVTTSPGNLVEASPDTRISEEDMATEVMVAKAPTPTLPPPVAAPLPVVTPLSPPPAPKPQRRPQWLLFALIALLLIVLIGGGLGGYFLFSHGGGGGTNIVGEAFFVSSGYTSEDSGQGINDELQINLHNIPAPAAGNSYYAWLLGDTDRIPEVVSLGRLTVQPDGTVSLLYAGDVIHDNQLEVESRFLITQEDTNSPPIRPTIDQSKWRYYAAFPQTPNPQDSKHYSLLDHIRHLLSGESKLGEIGLDGGVSLWLSRNAEKILEWAGGARDDWHRGSVQNIQDAVVRILDYLDGIDNVRADIPATIYADPLSQITCKNAEVALLGPPSNQAGAPLICNSRSLPVLAPAGGPPKPLSYLQHVGFHMDGILTSPGITQQQHQLATEISRGIDKVTSWLEKVRADAQKLILLSKSDLLQLYTFPILDDMANWAERAYSGQKDSVTNSLDPGVSQFRDMIQQLATFEIQPFTA